MDTDIVTDNVCDWLIHHGHEFERINLEKANEYEVDIHVNNEQVDVILNRNKQRIKAGDMSSVWFRRGYLNFVPQIPDLGLNYATISSMHKHIINENGNITHTKERMMLPTLQQELIATECLCVDSSIYV